MFHNDWATTTLRKGWRGNNTLPFLFAVNKRGTAIDFRQAARNTINLLHEQRGTLNICLSGGYDSEYVCRIAHEQTVPFVAHCIDLSINSEELEYAYRLIDELKLNAEIHRYDVDYAVEYLSIINEDNHFHANNFGALTCILERDDMITAYGDPIKGEMYARDFYYDTLYPSAPGAFFTYTNEMFESYRASLDMRGDETDDGHAAKCVLYNLPYREKTKVFPQEISSRIRGEKNNMLWICKLK